MYIVSVVSKEKRLANSWPWRLVTISSSQNGAESDVFKLLSSLTEADRDNLLSMFELACRVGPTKMPRANRHEMDVNHSFLMEFRKKRHRIAWFYDEGKLIVCTVCFYKGSNDTPAKDQKAALKAYNAYHAAKKSGQLKDTDR